MELAPADSGLRVKLAGALIAIGELPEAERQARRSVELSPCGDLEVTYLSGALRAAKRYADQRRLLEEVIGRCASGALRNEYAYFLATCPDAAQRNAVEALRVALSITEQSGTARPEFLDTLAAAYAENGQFERAVSVQREAIASLERRSAPEAQQAELRRHLKRFEAGQPIRSE